LVHAARLSGLILDFDALRTSKRNGGSSSCFFDDAPVVAHLHHVDGHSITIFIVTSNCFSATTGDVTRNTRDAAWLRLRKQLLRLTAR